MSPSFPFTPDKANIQPTRKGIKKKKKRFKDFPTGVPTSIINVRSKVTLLLLKALRKSHRTRIDEAVVTKLFTLSIFM